MDPSADIANAVIGGVMAVVYGAIAIAAFCAAAVGLLFIPLYRVVTRRLENGTAGFQRRLDHIVQQASTLHQPFPPSVFLKPIGDEAALALAWTSGLGALGQAASSLLFLALRWIRDRWMRVARPVRALLVVLLTVAWSMGTVQLIMVVGDADPVASALELIRNFGNPLGYVFGAGLIGALVTWTVILLIVAALGAVMIVTLMVAAGVGMPSLSSALYFRICVEAIPTGSHQLVLVNVSPSTASENVPSRGLSHSALYSNPGAIRAVLDALDGFESKRSALSGRPLRASASSAIDSET